jgi:hypothetical protein
MNASKNASARRSRRASAAVLEAVASRTEGCVTSLTV